MFLQKISFGIIGVTLACGVVVFAQQPQTGSAQDDTFRKERIERMGRHRERAGRREGTQGHEGMGRRGGAGRLMRELNLSDEQRQQSRAIMQRRLESTKTQREELSQLREKRSAGTLSAEDEARAKALHQEIRTTMQGVRSEMAGVLTAEQKTKLEGLQAERKAKHEQRMKARQELRNKPQ